MPSLTTNPLTTNPYQTASQGMSIAPKDPRSVGISAIMSNPKLSTIIDDAMRAPLGSSKREKAAAILKSVTANQNVPNTLSTNPYQQGVSKQTSTPVLKTSPAPTTPTPVIPAAPALNTTPSQIFKTGLPPLKSTINEGVSYRSPIGADPGVDTTGMTVPNLSAPTSTTVPEGSTRTNPTTGRNEQYTPSGEWLPEDAANNPDAVDEWYFQLQPEERDRFSTLYYAYKDQIGPKSFAAKVKSGGEEKMKEMFPNNPEFWNLGPSLTSHLNELKSNLDKEYGLTATKNNLEALRDQGVTIDEDIQSYIDERDSYQDSLDRMINNFQQKSIKMDLSNPYNAKIADNYLGYLNVLKGREQKGYAEYLKKGVKYYKSAYQMAENNYNRLKDQFDSTLSTMTSFDKENYNTLNDILEEMYTNLNNKEANQLKKVKAVLDLDKTQKEIIDTALENKTGVTDKFKSAIEKGRVDLEQGLSWGEIYNNIRRDYPSVSGEEIDERLGGGYASNQAQADKHGVKVGEYWGKAKPGWYQEWSKSKKTANTGSGSIFDSLPAPKISQ